MRVQKCDCVVSWIIQRVHIEDAAARFAVASAECGDRPVTYSLEA